jgi:hypothetical protein
LRFENDGPDFGLIGDPPQLISRQLGAVAGFGKSGFGEQVFEVDGDDHRRRSCAARKLVFGLQDSAADFIERIVQPLPRRAAIGDLGSGSVLAFDAAGAWFGEWFQDRVELGTDGVGESALQPPHAVAALFQLQVATVLLVLVIDRFGSVGVGRIDDFEREPPQLRRTQDRPMVGEQLLGGVHSLGVQTGTGELVHGPLDNRHLLGRHSTIALQCGQLW